MITKRNENGQTMILIMFVLVIMVIAGVFLFDLQSMIRGKIKSQTAVDSAALVGAEWQMHTLNMIGELNLIKASTALLTDYNMNATTYNDVTFLDSRMAELTDVVLTQTFTNGDPPIDTDIDKEDLVSSSHGETEFGFAEYREGFDNMGYVRDSDDEKEWHWQSGADPLQGKDLIYSLAGSEHDQISFTIASAGIIYVAVQTNILGPPYTLFTDDSDGNRLDPTSETLGPWEYIPQSDIWLRLYNSDGSEDVNTDGSPISDGLTMYRRFFEQSEVGNSLTLTPNTGPLPIIFTLQNVEEIPEGMKDELRSTAYAADRISNMQARVSFVGPMIGFGAAQQAAKNNGLANNDEYTEVVWEQYLRLTDDGGPYSGAFLPQEIPYRPEEGQVFPYDYTAAWGEPGYSWRWPYHHMLEPIARSGIAVAPNVRFLGIPDMLGNTWFTAGGYAVLEDIYDAVNGNDWCVLERILDENYGAGGGAWWGEIDPDFTSVSFVEESEYLSVGVTFKTLNSDAFDPDDHDAAGYFIDNFLDEDDRNLTSLRSEYDASQAYEHNDNDTGRFSGYPDAGEDTDGKYDPLAYIEFCAFDGTWWSYDDDMLDDWETYTEKNFVAGMSYWGASVRMSAELETSLLSNNWGHTDEYVSGGLVNEFSDHDIAIGENGSNVTSLNQVASRVSAAEHRMRNMAPKIKVSAAAKPYGRFNIDGEINEPHVAGIVLPVFTDVALIPVSLEDPGGLDPFNVDFYRWVTEGLPILGTHNDLGGAQAELQAHSHWSSFSSYFAAIERLNDPNWRQTGLDWLEVYGGNCNWASGNGGSPNGPSKLH